MVFLKEDGTLDIERINQLPIEEYMKMIGELSDEQLSQYESTFPENDGTQHTKAIVVDYTMEDEIKRGCIILKDYLNEKKKKYGIGKMINNNEYLQMSRNLYSNV